ncbi:hypothetical protein TNCV_1977381 [Trichonephila clavipes]|nr:hypothetical protein TNCV_1977381 [Trichonephila clavipes]
MIMLSKGAAVHSHWSSVARKIKAEMGRLSGIRFGNNERENLENKMPLRHEGILNSLRVASSLVKLVEGDYQWEASDHPQGGFPID